MPNNSSDQSSAHVTLATADLDTVFGGQAGPGAFPAQAVATAAGDGIKATAQNWGNIKNTFNDAHRWGHENGWAAINGVKNAVGNVFSGSGSSNAGANVPTGVP